MTRLLAILEERSLIEKVKQKDNNKIVNKIRLTEHGKELKERITPFMHKSREKYLKDISADDIYICIKVLSKIHENLVCEE
jgi:DNA-binding MarR family transcriptional regulator